MITVVLAGLIATMCYCFIDDLVTWARNHDEMHERVRTILLRIHKHNMIIAAKKCQIAKPELESLLGYHFTADGVKHSADKKQKAFDFPLPDTKQRLMSFLGLAVYFKNHIKDFSITRKAFYTLLKEAKSKKTQLTWNPTQLAAFEKLKNDIYNCPMLYHRDDSLELHCETDASNYGIGAYIYQLRDGKQEPLHFVSLAFNDVQTRWKINEQEAFAPFFALSSCEHLFRGQHFHLHTDHRNLLYMSKCESPKITRWLLTLQEFDFTLHHKAGRLNLIADILSRLHQDQTIGIGHHKNMHKSPVPMTYLKFDESTDHGMDDFLKAQIEALQLASKDTSQPLKDLETMQYPVPPTVPVHGLRKAQKKVHFADETQYSDFAHFQAQTATQRYPTTTTTEVLRETKIY
jgi:hypothetical protein